MGKIIKCKKCGDIIQSKHRHDMVWCKCHSVAIDGGDDYCRWAGDKENIEFYIEESRFQTHKETDAKTIQEQGDLIEKLKQQLAEKEKELAYMTKQAKKFNNEAQKYFEDAYCNDSDNQDKISFAVEQFEKVKNEITPIFCVPNGIYSNLHNEVFKTIDNQIKLLKEGSSDE